MARARSRAQFNIGTSSMTKEVYEYCVQKIERKELTDYFISLVEKDMKEKQEESKMEKVLQEIQGLRKDTKDQLKNIQFTTTITESPSVDEVNESKPILDLSSDEVNTDFEEETGYDY